MKEFTLGNPRPPGNICFYLDNSQLVLTIIPNEGKALCEWGKGCGHWISLDCLDAHLSDLVSPELKGAIIKELKMKLNNSIKDMAKKHFNLDG